MKKGLKQKARWLWYSLTHVRVYVWRPMNGTKEWGYSSVYYDTVTYRSIALGWFKFGWNFCGA